MNRDGLTDRMLARGEALLTELKPMAAAASFDEAERMGASAAHCAGRRWTCYMLAGEYELAWRQSDAIRAHGAVDQHRVWDGTALEGKSVLVRSLHGFGDAVQMMRYASRMRAQVSRLTLQVAPQLVELARCAAGVDEVFAWEEVSPYDAQVEITELPYIFRSTLLTLPGVPYLTLSASSKQTASDILGAKKKIRVGLVWTSSDWDSSRSIPFHSLHPLLELGDNVEFWCLQPADPRWDAFSLKQGWPARDAGSYSAATFAACIAQMDLVITTDSFAAHLAGALATPAWVLLKQQADWRWMIEREDTPWYPSLRLFRQEKEGDWLPVIAKTARELKLLSQRRQRPAAHAPTGPV